MARRKTYWTPPRDATTGAYKLREEWTKSEGRAYRKAKKEGMIKASKQSQKMPRGPHGKFVSPTGKPSKSAKKVAAAPTAARPVYVEPTADVCGACPPVFPGLVERVAEPLATTTAQVAEIQHDIAEMKARLQLAPQQPVSNPLETLAIVNAVGQRDRGALDKLLDSVKDNPLLAAAAVGAAILISYLMYRSWRRTQEQTGVQEPAAPPVTGGIVGRPMPPTATTVTPAQMIPKHPTYRIVGSTMERSNVNVEQQSLPGLDGTDGDGDGIFA